MRTDRAQLSRALVALVVLALVALTARVLLVLFAGLLFAVVLRTLARKAAHVTHVPLGIPLVLLVTAVLGGFAGLIVVFAPRVVDELRKVPQVLPAALEHLTRALHLGGVAEPSTAKGTSPLAPDKLFSGAVLTANVSLEIVAGLVVIFFVGVYGAAEPRSYTRTALALVPEAERSRVEHALDQAASQLGSWLLGRLVAMAFVAVSCAVAFSLLGLPLALPLALLAGLFTFVEYVGAIASAIPAILFGLTVGVATALWVGVVFTALHVIEGYVLTPLLAKSTVRIPPAYGLASQVVLSALVGPLGLTFSTPLLVVVATLYQELRAHRVEAGLAARGGRGARNGSTQSHVRNDAEAK